MSALSAVAKQPALRLAAGGWAFFIAENAILSENRTWLIKGLGDDRYHLVYGTFSTLATASIGYGYYSIRKKAMPPSMVLFPSKPPLATGIAGWLLISTGLIMMSQAAPKMQIPVALVDTPSSKTLQVRCPFDFSDKNSVDASQVRGLERITRHPGLWSLGLVGMGNSMISASIPLRVWWLGPAAVAWLGGSHTDSRFRRGMGGHLPPEYDCQTSNIPFWAILCGKQGSGAWQALSQEIKPLNAAVAVGLGTLFVLRRIR